MKNRSYLEIFFPFKNSFCDMVIRFARVLKRHIVQVNLYFLSEGECDFALF